MTTSPSARRSRIFDSSPRTTSNCWSERIVEAADDEDDVLLFDASADEADRVDPFDAVDGEELLIETVGQIGGEAGGHVGHRRADEEVGDQGFLVPVLHVLDVVEHRVGQADGGAGGDEDDADGERGARTVDQQLTAGDAAFDAHPGGQQGGDGAGDDRQGDGQDEHQADQTDDAGVDGDAAVEAAQ